MSLAEHYHKKSIRRNRVSFGQHIDGTDETSSPEIDVSVDISAFLCLRALLNELLLVNPNL
jgi:hypothetical protein